MASMTTTDVGKNLLRDGNYGAADAKMFYIAVGTGATAPTNGDIALGTEAFRKTITTFASGGVGVLTANLYIEPTEAVGVTIAEVGIFGGDSATTAANSGVLVARGLYSPTHLKTNTESMTISVQLQYS